MIESVSVFDSLLAALLKDADYPWFWNGEKFTGDRVNDIHLKNEEKQAARDKLKEGREQP